jgi:hypothetical protein
MLRVFIGYDPNETVALSVLAHSIWRHAKDPVSITPLMLGQLPMTRERVAEQSTEFAFSRFIVPYLCGFEGRAVFMDCDMLCRADIGELFGLADEGKAVQVVKHDYAPRPEDKFLGQKQTVYAKKNWSSVMLFNCAKCVMLTPEYVNAASGLELHQFKWLGGEYQIGEIAPAWNHLVGEYPPNPDAKLAHFTLGTPCFAKYANCEFAQEWREAKWDMTFHNPIGEFSLQARTGT